MTNLPPVIALHDWTIDIAGKQFGFTQTTPDERTAFWFGGPFTIDLPISAPMEVLMLFSALCVLIFLAVWLVRKRRFT